jgi:hypothetical protein
MKLKYQQPRELNCNFLRRKEKRKGGNKGLLTQTTLSMLTCATPQVKGHHGTSNDMI